MIRTAKDARDMKRELPPSWRWVRLGDMCERSTATRDPRDESGTTFRYVDISSVDNGSKRITEARTLPGADAPSRARQVIRHNDILVATTRPNLNAVAMVPSDLDGEICSTGFCVLRATGELSPNYLFAYVQHEAFVVALSDLVKGALYPAVTDSQVKAQSIPLPPLPEQKRIAAILNEQMAGVERARVAAQAQLDDAKALFAVYLREVFPKPGQELSTGWRWARLGELCDIVRGSSPRPKGDPRYYGGTVPRLMVEDVTRDGMHVTPKIDSLTEEGARSSRPMKKGDVVIVVSGSPGLPAILNVDACIHDGFVGLRNLKTKSLNQEYLFYYLKWSRESTDEQATGAIFRNLTTDQIGRIQVPLPSLAEQKRIAAALKEKMAGAEKLRAWLSAQLAQINALPASLLRRAFAGEL